MIKHSLRQSAANLLESSLPYTSYPIGDEEYIGKYSGSLSDFEEILKQEGYHYQVLAAIKYLNGEADVGSYARIPEKQPEIAKNTGLTDYRECQYHVHLFENEETVELYGHYEVHPYPNVPEWDITRAYPRHYRPTWDNENIDKEEWTYIRGATDPRLEHYLE